MVDLIDDDNWLEKEKARERRVSAWDLDDGKKLKLEHEDNCDVELLANEHKRVHRGNIPTTINRKIGKNIKNETAKWIIYDVSAIFIFMLFYLIEETMYLGGFSIISAGIILYGLLFGTIINVSIRKKVPTASFYRKLFFIAVGIEILNIARLITEFIGG